MHAPTRLLLPFAAVGGFLLLHSPAAAASLAAGPMLGYAEMREAAVWVRTDAPAGVSVVYTEENGSSHRTPEVATDPATGNTATLRLREVEPGKTYSYQVLLDGEAQGPEDQYRLTTPSFYRERTPPPDLRIAVGGAHYAVQEGFEPPYQTLGGGYGIFSEILEADPDMMLWVGDTAHLRESDWGSRAGYVKRFAHSRARPEMKELLASVPHYAVWGETDFGPPASGRHWSRRLIAEETFRAFWPRPVDLPGVDGIAMRTRVSDVDFFFLDVRSYRDKRPRADELPRILGAPQVEWLRRALARSDATFKVIVSGAPVLNPAESPENLSSAEREHTELLQRLREARIPGLLFLSGGKPYGELTRLIHANSYPLFDLTVGPLTANPKTNEDELNFFRMPGTSSFERHFAVLDFTGPEEDRQVAIRVVNTEGEELWSRTVKASELQPAQKGTEL